MNAFFFASKRAFHGVLRVMRKPLASRGLTAARFDMMYALMPPPGLASSPMWQSDLRRTLGVSAPVVSRMVTALEGLGWVTQRVCEFERRQRELELTAKGLECIRTALAMLKGASKRVLYEAICLGRRRAHRDKNARLEHMLKLDAYLGSMCRKYGDTAMLSYPWEHPEDFCPQEDFAAFLREAEYPSAPAAAATQ